METSGSIYHWTTPDRVPLTVPATAVSRNACRLVWGRGTGNPIVPLDPNLGVLADRSRGAWCASWLSVGLSIPAQRLGGVCRTLLQGEVEVFRRPLASSMLPSGLQLMCPHGFRVFHTVYKLSFQELTSDRSWIKVGDHPHPFEYDRENPKPGGPSNH
jgi:hypothetical protein